MSGAQKLHQDLVFRLPVLASGASARALLTIMLSACLGLMSGCTFLPGMSAHYYKSAIVEESPEEPNTLDYTLIKVTPLLVKNMSAERLALEKQPVGAGPFNLNASKPYILGPLDVLRIFVWNNPDLSPTFSTTATSATGASNMGTTPAGRVINEKGELFFPMVGPINAAGLTISQFRALLPQRLSKYIKDPQIDVDVSAFRSQRVYLSGEVKTPGYLPVTDMPMRIADAISQSGGPMPTANLSSVIVTRNNVSATLNLERFYYNGDPSMNVSLQDRDIVTVPDRLGLKAYVLGEFGNAAGVNQARSYILRRGNVSLSEVIGDAGGLNPFSAAAGKVYVMRAGSNKEPLIYQLDARDPASLIMADQFMIQPKDVVFVAPTDITEFGRFVQQFFPLSSGVSAVTNTPY